MAGYLTFMAAFLRNRKTTGAVLPSSPALARAMVKALGDVEAGQLIIELGPGTGVFTRRIIEHYPDNPVMVVEFNGSFVHALQTRFPQVMVVNGCASELPQHLAAHGFDTQRVGGLISGLPLLSLPPQLRDGIWDSIAAVLPPEHRYVQFTYSKRAWRHFRVPHMQAEPTRRVYCNVPPAVVLPFRRLSA